MQDPPWANIVDVSSELRLTVETDFVLAQQKSEAATGVGGPEGGVYVSSQILETSSLSQDIRVLESAIARSKSVTQMSVRGGALELDDLNRMAIMIPLLRAFDRMEEMFSKSWNPQKPPDWIVALVGELGCANAHLNVKAFLLRLIVNKEKMFSTFKQTVVGPMCAAVVDVSKPHSGDLSRAFNYLLRDVTTTLTAWQVDLVAERDRRAGSDLLVPYFCFIYLFVIGVSLSGYSS